MCEDAHLEAAKSASLIQHIVDEEKRKLREEYEAQIEADRMAHHEVVAKLEKEKLDSEQDSGAQRSEIVILLQDKSALKKENKVLTNDNKRRLSEIKALKQEEALEAQSANYAKSPAGQALKAEASLKSILILKKKLEAEHPDLNWDVTSMVEYVIAYMESGRQVTDEAPEEGDDEESEDGHSSSDTGGSGWAGVEE
ncbi:unnamed protein product [Linum trigynum]|uniref:Uncharacterized protein n=1 Tax=Linum trigynum TaxID=586398 RepID=A0AAV2FXB1_9ROSI